MKKLQLKHRFVYVLEDGTIFNEKGKQLCKQDNGIGYLFIRIGEKNYYVNRIVLCAFTDKDYWFDMEANHKDRIRSNNAFSNLEWMTRSQNLSYARNKVITEITDSMVVEIRNLRKSGSSTVDISNLFKISPSYVSRLASGTRRKQVA